jgi:hypothetical protein
LNHDGYCSTNGCPNQELDLNNEAEEFCDYCGEPLEDGMCSASCEESVADEEREDGYDEDYQDTEINEEKIDL